jgi:hypothetical protein
MIRGAGRYSTLITPTAGSLFHAEFHAESAANLTADHGGHLTVDLKRKEG